MRMVVYARVSTEEQARSGFSLSEQLKACRARAAALAPGADLTEFVDDTSGELLERPGLQAALAFIRQESCASFVCLDPDRLARRLMHQLLLTDEIEAAGCRLEFVQHDYQETAEGRLFYQMRGAIAEFEKAKILERTARGRRGKIAAGGLPHLVRMYGYQFIKGAGKQAAAREVLVPDPREAAWVRQIYEWCATCRRAPGEIAAELNRLGVPTKTGQGQWRSTQVLRILRHPAYATGRLALGRRDYRGIGVARRLSREQRLAKGVSLTARPRPSEEWQHVEVQPLVAETLWAAAQAVLGRKPRKPEGALTGLGRCGLCRAPLYYVNGTRMACSGRYWGAGCTLPAKSRTAVEDAVWQAVQGWLLDPDLLAQAGASPGAPEEALEAELAARKAELARVGTLFARGLWPEPVALPAMESACRQIEALEARRGAAVANRAPDLAEIRTTLMALEAERRAELIRLAVDHFVMEPSGRGAAPAVTVIPARGNTREKTGAR